LKRFLKGYEHEEGNPRSAGNSDSCGFHIQRLQEVATDNAHNDYATDNKACSTDDRKTCCATCGKTR
jgi:hypothetical protein